MSILLDTCFVIGLLRGREIYWNYLEQLLESIAPSVSTVTRAEIYAGCHPSEETGTNAVLSCFRAIPVNSAIADTAGRYVYGFARRGVTLHLEDALIGATAVHDQLILVTQNVSHFPMLSAGKNLIKFPEP
jgi:predicted nucleic acid-binding protein